MSLHRTNLFAATLVVCLSVGLVLAKEPAATTSVKAEKPASAASLDATKDSGGDALQEQLKTLLDRRDASIAMRQELRKRVVTESGLSPENVKPILLEIERGVVSLRNTLEAKRVKSKVLTIQAEELRKQVKSQEGADPVVEGLAKVIAARQAILDDLEKALKSAGTGSRTDVHRAAADLAEAEVRLGLHKSERLKSAAAGEVEQVNRQVFDLSTEIAVDEARWKALEMQMTQLRSVENLFDEYEATVARSLASEGEINDARSQIMKAKPRLPAKE